MLGWGLLGGERGDQLWQFDNIEDTPEIVSERGQAVAVIDLLQAAHQRRRIGMKTLAAGHRTLSLVGS